MRRLIIPFIAVLMLASCDESTAPAAISDEQFIEAVIALRQAARAAGSDEAAFITAREQILTAQSLTEADLNGYLAAHRGDLQHLAAVWQIINTRQPELRVD